MKTPIETMIDKACGYSPKGSGSLQPLVSPARCPHCGGKATLHSEVSRVAESGKEKIYYACVMCVNQITCGAMLNVFLKNEDAARRWAVEQWNRRTNMRGELPLAARERIE